MPWCCGDGNRRVDDGGGGCEGGKYGTFRCSGVVGWFTVDGLEMELVAMLMLVGLLCIEVWQGRDQVD